MSTHRTIRLNKFNGRVLGASLFLGADIIAPIIKNPSFENITVEIESNKNGITIVPVEVRTVEVKDVICPKC